VDGGAFLRRGGHWKGGFEEEHVIQKAARWSHLS
jgi:hypothetical protein